MGTGGRGGGGETIVGTTPTGTGRGEGGDATAAVMAGMVTGRDGDGEGGVTKETVDGVTLG